MAIGPSSQAVIAGELIFTSGQLGIDPVTNNLKEGLNGQAVQTFQNLQTILEEAGSGLKNVIKTTVFLQDMNDFAEVNKIYVNIIGNHFPPEVPSILVNYRKEV